MSGSITKMSILHTKYKKEFIFMREKNLSSLICKATVSIAKYI